MAEKGKGKGAFKIIANHGSSTRDVRRQERFTENTIRGFAWGSRAGTGFKCELGGRTVDQYFIVNNSEMIGGRPIAGMSLEDVLTERPWIETFEAVVQWLKNEPFECWLEILGTDHYWNTTNLVSLIKGDDIQDKITVISRDMNILEELGGLGITRLGLMYENLEPADALTLVLSSHCKTILPWVSIANRKTLELFRRHGLIIVPWVVDNPAKFEEIRYLVDGIITNRPDLLKA